METIMNYLFSNSYEKYKSKLIQEFQENFNRVFKHWLKMFILFLGNYRWNIFKKTFYVSLSMPFKNEAIPPGYLSVMSARLHAQENNT